MKISAFVACDHEEHSTAGHDPGDDQESGTCGQRGNTSKDQEFDELMETYEDESAREALETYREDNPLHDAFYVEVNDGDALKDTAKRSGAIEGIVETVNYEGTVR